MTHDVDVWDVFEICVLGSEKTKAMSKQKDTKSSQSWSDNGICQLPSPTYLTCWLMSRLINCWGMVRLCVHVNVGRKKETERRRKQLTVFFRRANAKHRFSSCFWELGHFRLRFIFHVENVNEEEEAAAATRCVLECRLLLHRLPIPIRLIPLTNPILHDLVFLAFRLSSSILQRHDAWHSLMMGWSSPHRICCMLWVMSRVYMLMLNLHASCGVWVWSRENLFSFQVAMGNWRSLFFTAFLLSAEFFCIFSVAYDAVFVESIHVGT